MLFRTNDVVKRLLFTCIDSTIIELGFAETCSKPIDNTLLAKVSQQ